ncbi:MAG: CAP domain-containing protein [Bdellovibrionales bacterium]|nr:CAP domain-containing protein [Bdellovibrionales bacterium]
MKSSMRLGALFAFFLCTTAFAEAESQSLGAEESRFFGIINTFRARLSLPRLVLEPTLMLAARNHSTWMAGMDFLTHYGPVNQQTPFQRMRGLGYSNYTFAGENIACGFGGATDTFLQFSKSPTHLRNMMHPQFHQMGIARAGTGKERCPFYWANEFGSIRPESPEPEEINNPDLVQEAIELATGRRVETKEVEEDSAPSSAGVSNQDAIRINPLGNLDITIVQCTIPSTSAKGIFTFNANTDAIVEFERDTNSVFRGKVSYVQNGKASLLAPVFLGTVSVVSNAEFPILSVFSAPGARIGGFSIQLNTRTNQAQFDGFPARPGSAGSVLCTMKF